MIHKLFQFATKPALKLNTHLQKPFAYLVGNLPPIELFVRKEYVTQFEEGHGELEEGVWITVKSKKDRAFLFETLFCEYGAVFDKLPISAFLWKKDVDFDQLLPLDYLQLWNSFSYNFTVIKKVNLADLRVEVLMKNGKWYHGAYMFTIDNCSSDPNELTTSWAEIPHEHKSFNIIKLDNGQFCAQPNNRIKWKQSSLIPVQTKSAKFFKVCTIDYQVEDTPKWSVAETMDYFYKEVNESKVLEQASASQEQLEKAKTEPAPQAPVAAPKGTATPKIKGEKVTNSAGGGSKPY